MVPELRPIVVRFTEMFAAERKTIYTLFKEFYAIWDDPLRDINLTEHRIELAPDAKPVHQPPYRAGMATRAVLGREIAKIRESGVVKLANEEWASPVVFVRQ